MKSRLTSDEAELLLKEATLGIGPTIDRVEAIEYYERITKQIREIRDKGGAVDIPSETPSAGGDNETR